MYHRITIELKRIAGLKPNFTSRDACFAFRPVWVAFEFWRNYIFGYVEKLGWVHGIGFKYQAGAGGSVPVLTFKFNENNKIISAQRRLLFQHKSLRHEISTEKILLKKCSLLNKFEYLLYSTLVNREICKYFFLEKIVVKRKSINFGRIKQDNSIKSIKWKCIECMTMAWQ